MSVTEFSLSCFLTRKDTEKNCTICLNAKEKKKEEGKVHTCVYSGNRMRQETSLLHVKAKTGDRRVFGGKGTV